MAPHDTLCIQGAVKKQFSAYVHRTAVLVAKLALEGGTTIAQDLGRAGLGYLQDPVCRGALEDVFLQMALSGAACGRSVPWCTISGIPHGYKLKQSGIARGGLWADRIMVPPFSKLAVEGGHGTAEDLERAAAAWRQWAAHRDAWFVMVQGEIVCRKT